MSLNLNALAAAPDLRLPPRGRCGPAAPEEAAGTALTYRDVS